MHFHNALSAGLVQQDDWIVDAQRLEGLTNYYEVDTSSHRYESQNTDTTEIPCIWVLLTLHVALSWEFPKIRERNIDPK